MGRKAFNFEKTENRDILFNKVINLPPFKGLNKSQIFEKLCEGALRNPSIFEPNINEYKDIEALVELFDLYGKTIYDILKKIETLDEKVSFIVDQLEDQALNEEELDSTEEDDNPYA